MAAFKHSLSKYQLLKQLAQKKQSNFVPKRNLNLQEYHSKDLLKKNHVTVQDFRLLDEKLNPSALSGFIANEYVVKAQILAGGRGKGHFDTGFKGGVHLTKDRNDILPLAKSMVGHKLITKQTPKEGILVEKIMVAESVNIVRETYFSILMEREFNGPVLVASPTGGMDIETVAKDTPHLVKTIPIDIYNGVTNKIANEVADFLEFKGDMKSKCADEIKNLWQLFLNVDATQLEINPLVETDDGRVVAVDAKLNFDDNAQFRQKDIFALDDTSDTDPREREAASLNLNYIDMDGGVGCMVNGAGLAMATMDLITLAGGSPANFLDLGGGVGAKQVQAAMRILESDPKVKVVFVNVFGGTSALAVPALGTAPLGEGFSFGKIVQKEEGKKTRSIVDCTIIARGLIAAFSASPPKHPVIVRLEGTNATAARDLLKKAHLPLTIATDAEEGARLAVGKAN